MMGYQPGRTAATAVILLYTLLRHGFLFLYSGGYSDGWLFYTYLSAGRLDLLHNFFLKQGHPQTAYLYLLFSWTPRFLLLHRLMAFASLAAVGLLPLWQLFRARGLLRYRWSHAMTGNCGLVVASTAPWLSPCGICHQFP